MVCGPILIVVNVLTVISEALHFVSGKPQFTFCTLLVGADLLPVVLDVMLVTSRLFQLTSNKFPATSRLFLLTSRAFQVTSNVFQLTGKL